MAMPWLIDCGLAHKISRVSKPAIPLKAYEDMSAFKLYVVDIGLMCAMVDLDVRTLLEGNNLFEEFKSALTEQFVLQQMILVKEMSIYFGQRKKQLRK